MLLLFLSAIGHSLNVIFGLWSLMIFSAYPFPTDLPERWVPASCRLHWVLSWVAGILPAIAAFSVNQFGVA